MQMQPTVVSVFFHNYYGKDKAWMDFFATNITVPFSLFYSRVANSYHHIMQNTDPVTWQQQVAGTGAKQVIVKAVTNKGKDIGGKLVLLDAYLRLGIKSDFILLLHDKVSPYHSNAGQWQKSLFRIAEKDVQEKVFSVFREHPKVGIVAAANLIRNEADNEQKRTTYTDAAFIKDLRQKYNIHPPHLNYVAGTMFWVRAALLESFFTKNPPLEIRSTLEEGNVIDDEGPTVTHAWERLLCWMATANGYQIKGV